MRLVLREERRELILKYIHDNRVAASEELSHYFKVTNETIRQDLNALSEAGHIIRTFGGAMLREDYEPSLEQRAIINYEEKHKIARAALPFICRNDLIVMDAGSTVVELSRMIEKNSDIVVVTNSLEVLNRLAKVSGVTVIGTGGTLRSHSMSFQGRNAENALRSYNLKKAFITAEAIGLDEGIMDTNEPEASVKKCMIETAHEVTLLVDHSKFACMGHITVCPLEKIHRVITDAKTDKGIIQKLRQKGLEVIITE